VGAFMGQRIISQLAGQNMALSRNNLHTKYLANLTPSIYEQYFEEKIPFQMKGEAFIRQYRETIDDVTEIKPGVVYKIKTPTAHPVYENFRVHVFAELFQKPLTEEALKQLGEFMYQSHASYSACGLGSPETDKLVELTRELGLKAGLFGAKITGGGSGGTVAILGKAEASLAIEAIVEKYVRITTYQPYVFRGSSMGAAAFGHITLKKFE
jgi:L-arabinokinase